MTATDAPKETDAPKDKRLSHAESARTLLAAASRGVLSTLDRGESGGGGYPYGSLAEFVCTDDGDAIFLLSDLAEHTKNFKEDARASLFVSPAMTPADTAGGGNPLALERATLLGDIELVDDPDTFRDAYLERHPNASGYIDFSDFSFWRLRVRRARYIGGFGRMSWVDQDAYRSAQPDPLARMAAGAIEHMNDDHSDAVVAYVRAFSELDQINDAKMVALDRFGFDIQAHPQNGRSQLVRVHFDEPLERPSQVRKAMVNMVKKARDIIEG